MKSKILLALVLIAPGLLAQDEPSASPSPEEAPQTSEEATPKPIPPKNSREFVDSLNKAQIEKAIQGIKSNYIDPRAAEDMAVLRATLEGLVERLGPGAELKVTDAEVDDTNHPSFLAEILDERVGYIRLGDLTRESVAQMDASLEKFNTKELKAVILDLRAAPEVGDYELAADVARKFSPKGKLLFSIQKPSAKQERIFTSNQEPAFEGILVVLVDQDTRGPAEATAAAVRAAADAMIVGHPTAGAAAEQTRIDLGEGKHLAVAIATVKLPDESSIFPGGVRPDITIRQSPEVRDAIFDASIENGVSQYVFESERPRLNEAALLANVNPEIAPTPASGDDGPGTLRDRTLQRGVDLVTAILFYEKLD